MSQHLLWELLKGRFTLLYWLNTRGVYSLFNVMNWSKNGLSLSKISENQTMFVWSINTLHLANHVMLPVEHVLFTTCQLDSFQTINQWYPNLFEQGWKTITQRKAITKERLLLPFPPSICDNMWQGQGSCFLYPMPFREAYNNHFGMGRSSPIELKVSREEDVCFVHWWF